MKSDEGMTVTWFTVRWGIGTGITGDSMKLSGWYATYHLLREPWNQHPYPNKIRKIRKTLVILIQMFYGPNKLKQAIFQAGGVVQPCLPSMKLTARPWTMMVGFDGSFPFGMKGLFSGAMFQG